MKREASSIQKVILAILVGFMLFTPLIVLLKTNANTPAQTPMFIGIDGYCGWKKSTSSTSNPQGSGGVEGETFTINTYKTQCLNECGRRAENQAMGNCRQSAVAPPFVCVSPCTPTVVVECHIAANYVTADQDNSILTHTATCTCHGGANAVGTLEWGCENPRIFGAGGLSDTSSDQQGATV